MYSQIASVAENDSVRVLSFAVIADRTSRVLDGHMRRRLWYALDLVDERFDLASSR